MARNNSPDRTISKSISATLADGTVITGTVRMDASGRGGFHVQYETMTKTDGRSSYKNEGEILAMARIILREMAEDAKHRGLR